jgi:hypothetical protein
MTEKFVTIQAPTLSVLTTVAAGEGPGAGVAEATRLISESANLLIQLVLAITALTALIRSIKNRGDDQRKEQQKQESDESERGDL